VGRKKKLWLLASGCGCAVLGVAVLGGLALFGWAVLERRKPGPVVEVVTCCPGLSAASIEKLITTRVERWVNQANGAETITSRSVAGVSVVRVAFRRDIAADAALSEVNGLALGGALPVLPAKVLPPVVLLRGPRSSRPVGLLVLDGAAGDEAALTEAARKQVRDPLGGEEGASAPLVLGGQVGDGQGQTARLRLDGRPVVGVPIYVAGDAKPGVVVEKIAARRGSLAERLPPGMNLRWVPFGVEGRWGRADDSLLLVFMRAPSHSHLAATEKRVADVARLIEQNVPANERLAILCEVGLAPDLSAAYSANAGPMDATFYVQLSAARTLPAAALAARLRRLFGETPSLNDLRFRFASQDMPRPVNVRVDLGTTRNGADALRVAQDVEKRLVTDVKGIADWEIVQRLDAPAWTVRADARRAAALGLSCRQVIAQIFAALKMPAPPDEELQTDVGSGDQSVTLLVRTAVLDNVLDVEVAGAKEGPSVKLVRLANLRSGTTAVEINHENLVPVLNVRANIEGRDRGDVIADVRKMLTELKVPAGMRVDLAD
jgi:multidrug efflux pump subunit AcrB